jgi:hypothetical protein
LITRIRGLRVIGFVSASLSPIIRLAARPVQQENDMTAQPYDLVIRGGTVGTAAGTFQADVAIRGETIVALGQGLASGTREIDATGKLVLPGGVDTHAHIEQVSAGGLLNADTFESATASAAFGGTTTVMSFAAQHRGFDLREVMTDYAALARRGAMIDYAFHMIVANPDAKTLATDLPELIAEGHASIKVFMTYDLIKVDDESLLDLLLTARQGQALVCVHAENHGMISWMGKKLVAKGYSAPKYHAISHPRGSEAEAFTRLITAAGADRPADHDLPRLDRGRRGRHSRGTQPGAESLRRDLSAISLPDAARSRQARTGRSQMDVLSAAAREVRPGRALARTGTGRPPDDLVRPRALSLR